MIESSRARGELRLSALWGKRSEVRGSALWGKGGRRATMLVLVFALLTPLSAVADTNDVPATLPAIGNKGVKAAVTKELLEAAKANPKKIFRVVVQADFGKRSGHVAAKVRERVADDRVGSLRKQFGLIEAVSARLTGAQVLRLARTPGIGAITEDAPVRLAGVGNVNKQQWPYVSEVAKYWDKMEKLNLQAPTIAIVDSGIAAERSDFGGRVLTQVDMTALEPDSPGDGRGHGTFVAAIAAGEGQGRRGALPNAKIVSVDVMDDRGMAMTSDVIAAADWILRNKDTYGIKIANFSLHSTAPASFMFDPLDKAVEKLWFSGVTVIAAAGNYGVAGQMGGVKYAPGNDPFIITVGAVDVDGSIGPKDDFNAPWSAYGYTYDGFAKPDLSAPGRYMVGAVPTTATLTAERPDKIVAPGYMQMSGTSFAAPVVAGAAGYILALHPEWTPDQVKGALMLTAKNVPHAPPISVGVGQVAARQAAELTTPPPNPNAALNQFVTADPTGDPTPVFDAASWANVAQADASWASASWASASWASASWASASWASASWASASWASASWASASWASASIGDFSESDASWASNAEDDTLAAGGYYLDTAETYVAESSLELDLNGDGIVGEPAAAVLTLP